MTIEETIHLIAGRAAVLRYLASAAAVTPEHPDRAALDGMADLAEDIEQYLQAIKQRLGVAVLNIELPEAGGTFNR